MLRRLSLSNFVIVSRLDVDFGPGFAVLTGETGAGKSILIDALQIVLGGRGDAGGIHLRQRLEGVEIAGDGLAQRQPVGPVDGAEARVGRLQREQRGLHVAGQLELLGGDQSVRGYGYQELGVKEGDATVGGRYMLTGSAEYQYWFKPKWAIAAFYDAGNSADTVKAAMTPKSGYGLGGRYKSPVGPINVDVAYGHAVHKFRLHFSLGFTF